MDIPLIWIDQPFSSTQSGFRFTTERTERTDMRRLIFCLLSRRSSPSSSTSWCSNARISSCPTGGASKIGDTQFMVCFVAKMSTKHWGCVFIFKQTQRSTNGSLLSELGTYHPFPGDISVICPQIPSSTKQPPIQTTSLYWLKLHYQKHLTKQNGWMRHEHE